MRPDRDELGLHLARVWATRGTCGRRRVGCLLFDRDGWQIGSGYNGPPSGEPHCSTDAPCAGFSAPSGTGLRRCEAVHAEINALSRCRDVREIHTCYVTCSPCADCVKALLNTPCERVVFSDPYASEHYELSRDRWLRAGRKWIHQTVDPLHDPAMTRELHDALTKIAGVNFGPDRGSAEWRAGLAETIASTALAKYRTVLFRGAVT